MPSPTADIRVLIIADDLLARAGLASLIGNEPGLKVAGQIDSAEISQSNVEIYRADVIVLDIGWTPKPISESVSGLDKPLLILIPSVDFADEAWASGTHGVLLRNTSAAHLATAIRTLFDGLMVLDPSLTLPVTHLPERPTDTNSTANLTAREVEVLRLIAEGLPNKSIAQRLVISEHTVKFHINSLLSKLNAQSRTEAVIRATRLGIIPL